MRRSRRRLPMAESLAHRMRTVSRLLMRNLEERVSVHGISQGMWFYLRVLWEHDGISQKELSERTGVVGPSTVGAIARMQTMGFIECRKDELDRRVTKVYLTAKGRALEAKLVPHAIDVINEAVDGLSRERIEMVKTTLDHMRRNLGG